MPQILQQRQLRTSNVNVPFSSKYDASNRGLRKPRLVVQAGLFNFLSKPSAAQSSERANALVDEIFALTRNTNAGASLSQQKREQLQELIVELQEYCPRNPLRNKLLFGTYEVLYAFAGDAVGGPLRSGAGPILFPGQKPFQVLEEPNKIVNRLEFKALGFLPGYGQQTGTFRSLNADTFELNLTERQVSTGFGGEEVKEISFVRKIQILYLDERCRVARFIPEPTEGQEEPRQDAFFVFQRVVEESQQVAEPVEEEAPAKGTAKVGMFGGRGPKPGLATLAERKVREQLEADAQSGKPVPARGTSMLRAARSGTGVVKTKPASKAATTKGVDPRVAAVEKKRAEAAAAKERARAQQREAEERGKREEAARLAKERAEAERQAKQQRLQAVKDALNKLGAELQEAQVASRAAKVELRDLDKETAATNKKTAEARAQLEAAIARTQAAAGELQAAVDARNNAQAEARQAQASLKEAEKKYREQQVVLRR